MPYQVSASVTTHLGLVSQAIPVLLLGILVARNVHRLGVKNYKTTRDRALWGVLSTAAFFFCTETMVICEARAMGITAPFQACCADEVLIESDKK
eukprot:6204762-Pleurochrysis_carterae.AAC.2